MRDVACFDGSLSDLVEMRSYHALSLLLLRQVGGCLGVSGRSARLPKHRYCSAQALTTVDKRSTAFPFEWNVRGVGVQEAKELAEKDEYVLIDVRPRERYEESRVPGAISVPLYQKVLKLSM